MSSPVSKRGIKTALICIVAAVMALAVGACGDDGAGDDGEATTAEGPTTIRGAIVPTATHLPIMVAQEEGFFEENGLELELEIVQNLATLPGAMGRQFDFGSSTIPDVIKARQQGIDISIVTGISFETEENQSAAVVASPESGITELADLPGNTVGVITLGGNIHIATLDWLIENEVDPERIDFVEVPPPNQPDQLSAGEIDAVETLEPFRSVMIESGAIDLGTPFLQVAERSDLVSWMAASDYAEQNPEVVEGMVASLQQGIDFIEEDEPRAREILGEFAGLPPEVYETVRLPIYDTNISPDLVPAWAESLERIGQIDDADAIDTEGVLALPPNAE